MIFQGGNTPISLEFSERMDDITKFSAVLTRSGRIVKKGDKGGIYINKTSVELPLTESETAGFIPGVYKLGIKWLKNDVVKVAETAEIEVVSRNDKGVAFEVGAAPEGSTESEPEPGSTSEEN